MIFTPDDNRTLVATFEGKVAPALTADQAAKLYEDLDRERELKSIERLMTTRTGVRFS
jgi:hypothetical protein